MRVKLITLLNLPRGLNLWEYYSLPCSVLIIFGKLPFLELPVLLPETSFFSYPGEHPSRLATFVIELEGETLLETY